MTTSPPTDAAGINKYSIPLLLAFIAAGLVGNYFKYPIFLNIDFLFGSIFAMLALQFFGLGRGIFAAAIIASYTYILWNHPYAIIIMTAEVAVVGWLMTRRKVGLVLADTLYWLIIGLPLVYLFYHLVMHVPTANTYIVMTKQAVNGIANALVARLIFTAYLLRSRSSLISYNEIISNLLVFFLLFPMLIVLARESRKSFADTDLNIRSTMTQNSHAMTKRLETWVVNRKSAIINLAELAALHTPQQMQAPLEQAKKSDVSFMRIGILDREATITAYFPLIDELGQKNIGKNFADRPYIPILKQTLKPMLSEVVMGRIGTPKPFVTLLAPVVIGGGYGGFVTGILNLNQLQEYLDIGTKEYATHYTLIDKNDNVIMTNRSDQTVMKPFVRGKGSLTRLNKNISQWIPPLPANIPISERWKKSYYVSESTIGDLAEWRLILEQPVAPFQKTLYEQYTGNLLLLFLLLLAALALAEFLSRKAVATLGQLRALTYELPVRLNKDGEEIVWPDSSIAETAHLISNFREMADLLVSKFHEVNQVNETLEQRVEERTEELKVSEQRFRSFVENVNDVLFSLTPEGHFNYVSPQWKDAFGYELSETIGQPFIPFVHPEDVTGCVAFLKKVFETGERQFGVEYRVRHKAGSYVWYSANASRIEDLETGTPVLVGIGRNINDRKLAEVSLTESEQRFRSLMENIPSVAVQGYALDGTVLFWNQASELLYGYSTDEAMGANLLDLIIPPEMHEAVTGAVQQMIATGENIPAGELLLKRKDGSRIPVYSSHALVHPLNRQPELFCLDIDLSDRKQAETDLLESNRLLSEAKKLAESANTAKSQFLANMSHEIRTPMNGVLGMTQLLELTELTQEQREYVTALKLSGKNLMSLISDILDLSKIEAGKILIEAAEFSLKQCINDVVVMQKFALHEKRLKLEIEVSEDIPHLLIGDQLRIKQILLNLIGNAVKFTAQGSVTVSAHLLEQHDKSVLVQIAVRDTGVGISPEAVDDIFQPFTQEDGSTSRRYGGTGLGLTISRRLAELLGGTITVESTSGVGSCFAATIPFIIGTTIITPGAEPSTEAASNWDGPPLRILLVDDDQVNIKFGASLLKKLGHSVTTAENGRQCLVALENDGFDIVLMDVQMPVMNGEEALREIRTKEQGTTDHLSVIALTAHSMRGDMDRLREAGFDGYVSKPLYIKDLVAEMKRVWEADVKEAKTHG